MVNETLSGVPLCPDVIKVIVAVRLTLVLALGVALIVILPVASSFWGGFSVIKLVFSGI